MVPVDDHGEKAHAHDVEMAQVKAKLCRPRRWPPTRDKGDGVGRLGLALYVHNPR